MAATTIRSGQISQPEGWPANATIARADLVTNSVTAGTNVIAKAVQGTAITLSSTGGDAGTGDVTISLNAGVDQALTVAQTITVTDAALSTVTSALTFTHNSSGTPTTDFGVGIAFNA